MRIFPFPFKSANASEIWRGGISAPMRARISPARESGWAARSSIIRADKGRKDGNRPGARNSSGGTSQKFRNSTARKKLTN